MRNTRRDRYMRDRAARRNRDYGYPMDYRTDRGQYGTRRDFERNKDRAYNQSDYMDNQQPREYDRYNDNAIRGIGRPREYNYRDRRDYAEGDYDKEYHEDLKEWTEKLKRYDRFNMPKEQLFASARQMGVKFDEYDEEEFYAIYLMHVSDYPTLSNEPHVYLGMAKAWLEDKDLEIEPSEKVCKYLYEIVMADE